MQSRHRTFARRVLTRLVPLMSLAAILAIALLAGGCFRPQRGDPVDAYHYEHTVTVNPDLSYISIKTYINRTQWRVGFRREDLYDGDRDGALTTPGMDRADVTDYIDVEDPPESAVRQPGEISEYNDLFKRLVAEIKGGATEVKIEDRTYLVRHL